MTHCGSPQEHEPHGVGETDVCSGAARPPRCVYIESPVGIDSETYQPLAIVDGVIYLTDDEFAALKNRLERLEADDWIGDWSLGPVEPPTVISVEGILDAIKEDTVDENLEELEKVWEGR